MVANSSKFVLGRMIRADTPNFSAAVAQEILGWTFSEEDKERVGELLDKNSEGIISADEREELSFLVSLGDFLNLLHAKAHLSLVRSAGNLQAT